MDRQALIAAAIAYARSNEDTPATKNLAELHARMAISLLTGEVGMYDPGFLSEDAEKVKFLDQVPAAPVVAEISYEPMTPEEIAARMVEIDAETEANRIARGVSDFITQHADENDVLRLLARAPNGIYVDSSTPKSIYPTLRYDILNRAWATGIEHEEHHYQVRTFVINEHGLERLRESMPILPGCRPSKASTAMPSSTLWKGRSATRGILHVSGTRATGIALHSVASRALTNTKARPTSEPTS